MDSGAATAFLPNFVGFPSLRGLRSSTVQLWRTPGARREREHNGRAPAGYAARRAPESGKLSCPVSAASTASAPAAARGAPAARRVTTARVTAPAGVVTTGVVTARVVASGRRSGVSPAGPPAAAARPVRRRGRRGPGTGPPLAASRTPCRPAGRVRDDQQTDDRDRRHYEDGAHSASPSFRSPEAAPRGRLAGCRLSCGERGIPGTLPTQSRVEELQSLGAG